MFAGAACELQNKLKDIGTGSCAKTSGRSSSSEEMQGVLRAAVFQLIESVVGG